MSKKLLSIAVKGKNSVWGFNFYADPKHIKEWRDDGLDVVEIENIVPEWVANFNIVKEWCFLQDLFNFKNPFKDKSDTNSIIEEKDNDENK
jgi:hypothetical protein